MTESDIRNKIAQIIKNGVTYNHITETVLIHGAIEELITTFDLHKPDVGSNQSAIIIANDFLEWLFSDTREALPFKNPIKIEKSFGYWLLHHYK